MNDTWQSYFIDGTDVLKNKLGITNTKELEQKEKLISLEKLTYLKLFPINGCFDANHLKRIHKFLFDDIYYFAGEYRTCTLAKTTREFYKPEEIEKYLNDELERMNKDGKLINSLDYYSFFLADMYYQLMTVHPFREGNGRAVREFLREYVLENNKNLPFDVELDFSRMDKDEFLKAVEHHYIYPSLLHMLFKDALVEKNVSKGDIKKI